jgi:hypothetical protein
MGDVRSSQRKLRDCKDVACRNALLKENQHRGEAFRNHGMVSGSSAVRHHCTNLLQKVYGKVQSDTIAESTAEIETEL